MSHQQTDVRSISSCVYDTQLIYKGQTRELLVILVNAPSMTMI